MKRTVFLIAALALTGGSALAADLPSRKDAPVYVPPPPAFSWTGFYVGANLGGGWLDRYNADGWVSAWNGFGWTPAFVQNANSGSGGGVVGGGQIGYNYQLTPMFVVGLETDFQGTSVSGGGGAWGGPTRAVDWFGNVRGRIGLSYFSPTLLFYGTGGFAYGDIRLNSGGLGTLVSTGTGWTAGGGVEWAFMPNWSAKAEYLYTNIGADFGNNNNPAPFAAAGQWEHRVHMNTVRAGVNYHFNFGASAPVLAGF